jgi:putative ABC transport system permease protein
MNWVAWKMLNGDRAKYLGAVFGVAFGTLLIAQQSAIFVGLMRRTANQILDVLQAEIWVMDPKVENSDEIKPLAETDLYRIRGVEGVDWAVRLYKGLARVRVSDGSFRQVILMGLDDDSLVGAPVKMLQGTISDLRVNDSIIIDNAGFSFLWPAENPTLGKIADINDRRAVVTGICESAAPFQTFPIVFTRYSRALEYVPPERNRLSFVLAQPKPGEDVQKVCDAITEKTGLLALTRGQFMWRTVGYFIRTTGIPVNFGITVALGFIVGTAIAGQTFYLFVLENLKQFGALKAMGLSNRRLIVMVLLQAIVVGLIGFGFGMGMTAGFFEATKNVANLRGMHLPWWIALATAGAIAVIIFFASLLSIRKVLVLEPAVVFRG